MDPQPPKKPARRRYSAGDTPDKAYYMETPEHFERRMIAKWGKYIFARRPPPEVTQNWTDDHYKLRSYHFRRSSMRLFNQRAKAKVTGVVPEVSVIGDFDRDRWMSDQLKDAPYNMDLSDFPALESRRKEVFDKARRDAEAYGTAAVLDSLRKINDPAHPERADELGAETSAVYNARRRLRNAVNKFKEILNERIEQHPKLRERAEAAIKKQKEQERVSLTQEEEEKKSIHATVLERLARRGSQIAPPKEVEIPTQAEAAARAPVADVRPLYDYKHQPLRPPAPSTAIAPSTAPSSEPMPPRASQVLTQPQPQAIAAPEVVPTLAPDAPIYAPILYPGEEQYLTDPDNLLRSIDRSEVKNFGIDPKLYDI